MDEFYFLQLINDVARATQCSGISVYGARSETGHPMTARILDLYSGFEQLKQLQAVTTINYGSKSICLIGYLGHLVVMTGFNSNGVFAGALDSGTGAAYSSKDKYSYATDLRYALENSVTLNDVANYMTNPLRNYTFNHNVLLSDKQTSKVLENNFSGTGTNMQRALRSDTSALNPGISWGFTDAVAAVNSFLLLGNHDNHTGVIDNVNKWENLKSQLQYCGDTITFEELKLIASFDNGDGPDWPLTGDIYNSYTQEIILFEPDTFHLEIAFKPKSGAFPTDPVFENIPIEWDINVAYGHSLETDKKAPRTVNDTITIKATVENPCAHEISAMLIFENPDSTIVDSVEMTPVDPDRNKLWQCKWITQKPPEDIYWLSLKVTDITDGTYFTNKHLTWVTNIPLLVSKQTFKKAADNRYTVQTELKNGVKTRNISDLSIKLSSNDSWISSINPDRVRLDGIRAGQIKRIPASSVYIDENTFSNYVNLTFTISKNDWPYWVFDTTLYIVPTAIEQIDVPLSFELEQNFPNPFNLATTINWHIAENSKVTLKVLDIVGRTVATLVNEQRQSGNYETQFNAATLPKGIYFYQLKAGENMQTKKMILLE